MCYYFTNAQGGLVYYGTHLNDVLVGQALVWFIIFRVFEQDFVHVSRRVLIQLVAAAEYDKCYLTVAKHAQLVSFLHHAELALVESHLQ